MKRQYVPSLHLNAANEALLCDINEIVEDYQEQGYRLTLRQLYYQLVVRDIIANKQSEYSKLSSLLTKGRLAGVVDWDAIEDRLRVPRKLPSWDSPSDIVEACAAQYRRNRMENQGVHIEVWVEKDALSSVLKRAVDPYGCSLMVNRGYSSTAAMHDAYIRFAEQRHKETHVLYFGDHDPSGLDMVRDITDRIAIFADGRGTPLDFSIHRIALTTEQIDEYNPPPNPAKVSDPRATAYIERFGPVSWEVDALPPEVLNALVVENIEARIDMVVYRHSLIRETEERATLAKMAKNMERTPNNA